MAKSSFIGEEAPEVALPSTRQSIIELVGADILIAVGLVVTWPLTSAASASAGEACQNATNHNTQGLWMGIPSSELAIAAILIVSYLLNIVYKYLTGGLRYVANMLCGCHITTLLYIMLIFSPSHWLGTFLLNHIVYFTYNTTFALAVPDTKDCVYLFQVPIFWLQHGTLFVAPFILLWNGRWPILETNWLPFYISAVCFALFCHYNLQMVVGMLIKLNVNYTIEPPPGQTIVGGKYFRFQMALIIMSAMLSIRFGIVWTVALVKAYMYDSPSWGGWLGCE